MVFDIDFAKSGGDEKNYRLIHTASGLECLLVSTKNKCERKGETDTKATAAMSVQVGSFADPQLAEGCAHFLEHMVFMGSAKYPGENHYDSFVTSHGGSCNAFTEGEYTAYQFDVNAEHFDEALDIFGNCFIAPCLASSSTEREINAIESEFHLAKTSDGSRLQQLFCHQAEDNHILRKFSWGNMNSLKTIPEAHGVNMRATLRAFHSLHYVPETMKLVVLAPQTLDDLAALVSKCFGSWDNPYSTSAMKSRKTAAAMECERSEGESKKVKTDDGSGVPVSVSKVDLSSLVIDQSEDCSAAAGTVCTGDIRSLQSCLAPCQGVSIMNRSALQTLTRVVPLKNTHKLSLLWQMPPLSSLYRSKPCAYIAHVLGHEGAGSVFSFLKQKNFATSLSAGVAESNFDDNSLFTLFDITVTLTEQGLANWMYVAQIVFQYMRMLRDNEPDKRIFDELQLVGNLTYRFLDEEEPSEYAERLAIEMLPLLSRQPRSDILSAPHLFWEWRPDLVCDLLRSHLTAAKAKVTLISSSFSAPEEFKTDKSADHHPRTASMSSNAHSEHDQDSHAEESADSGDEDESGSEGSGGEEESEAGSEAHNTDNAGLVDRLQALYSGPEEWLSLVLPPAANGEEDDSELKCGVEPHFGTVYWESPCPAGLYELWEMKPDEATAKHMHLPMPNPYIAENLDMISLPPPQPQCATEQTADWDVACLTPEKILIQPSNMYSDANAGVVLWHIPDVSFGFPKVEIGVRLVSALAYRDPQSAACVDLLGKILYEQLNEEIYMASMAELFCDVRCSDIGIKLSVSGFSDKASLLTASAVRALLALGSPPAHSDELTEDKIFRRLREQLLRQYGNATLKADACASAGRLSALKPSRCSCARRKDALLEAKTATIDHSTTQSEFSNAKFVINLGAVREFAKDFMRSACLEFTVQGNMTRQRAVELVEQVLNHSPAKVEEDKQNNTSDTRTATSVNPAAEYCGQCTTALSPKFLPAQPIVQIPANTAVLLRQTPTNPLENNSCVEAYFQLGAWSLQDVTCLDLLEQLLTEKFFNELRTQQQLGYSVSCSVRQTYGTLGFCFQVTSSKFPVDVITSAIFQFISEIPGKYIEEYTSEEYLNNQQALRSLRRTPEQSLGDSARVLRDEIEEGLDCFHVAKKQADLLDREELFTKEIMQSFSKRVFCLAPKVLLVWSTRATVQDGSYPQALPSPCAHCPVLCVTEDPTQLHRLFAAAKSSHE